MAKIIPAKPRGKPDKAFTAFFSMLRKLPDDFTAWLPLENKEGVIPQVFLVWRERHAFLIQVAGTSQQLADSSLHGDFFTRNEAIGPDALGKPESDVLEGFLTRSGEMMGPLAGKLPIKCLVVFPNVGEGTIDEVMMLRSEESGVSYLGMHRVQTDRLARRLEALAEAALPPPVLGHLRRIFTPESEVPESFVARTPLDRGTAAALPVSFLDFDQEWCVKNDLDFLSRQELTDEAGVASVRLVTGVAGSGKSLVLLYRAILSARLHPGVKMLVLTHNKPLSHELARRSARLDGMPKNLVCLTFFQWAAKHLGRWEGERPWSPAKVERQIANLRDGFSSLENLSPAFLTDEIGWIKDQGFRKKDAYLEADRVGRGTALRANQREELWSLYSAYQHLLRDRGAVDWHNIALRFHEEAVVKRSLGFPAFDAIFIDEAQFFAKTWFEIARAALKPGGHLFLAADPTQGFLRRRQSWIAAGIDVRGRSTKLTRPYRNTRAILRFAREFHESRGEAGDVESDLNVPDEAQLAAIAEEGEEPVVLFVATDQDEIARAVNEVSNLMLAGLQPGKLLVLHANSALEGSLRATLEQKIGSRLVHDAKSGPMPDAAFCSVTTLNAGTGLEAPVVILLGMDYLLDKESDLRLSEEEKRDLRRDHTRMLYMGFTRAGQRLIVIRRKPMA